MKKKRINLKAPAKINLHLEILGVREDGYHELNSIFCAVSLCDDVAVSNSVVDSLKISGAFKDDVPDDSQNLVWKITRIYRERTKWFEPLKIEIIKNIPVGAGLGGGSSDASAVLFALNKLSPVKLRKEEMFEVAGEVGSDTFFFLNLMFNPTKSCAIVQGRGEKISDFSGTNPFQDVKIMLLCPDIKVSTAEVYRKFDEMMEEESYTATGTVPKSYEEFRNDLEKPAFALHPQLNQIKNILSPFSTLTQMSGSGSSFFCISPKRTPAFFKGRIESELGLKVHIFEVEIYKNFTRRH